MSEASEADRTRRSVLVTGGAGYIGSHIVRTLQAQGDDVCVVDDLSSSDRRRIRSVHLTEMNLSARDAKAKLTDLLIEQGVTHVVHMAARKSVPESVQRPLYYHRENVGGLINLLDAMEECNVRRLVFASTAAIYGSSVHGRVDETSQEAPVNPYGETKLAGERLIKAASSAWGLRAVALRFFNVAGAGWNDLGDPATMNLLTASIAKISRGLAPEIFGDDYPTRDGTCIRDYVHVMDISDAHIRAMQYLEKSNKEYSVFNLSTGVGTTVREILDELRRQSGIQFETVVGPRRPGDVPRVEATSQSACEQLGWRPVLGIPDIVASGWKAYAAHSAIREGPKAASDGSEANKDALDESHCESGVQIRREHEQGL